MLHLHNQINPSLFVFLFRFLILSGLMLSSHQAKLQRRGMMKAAMVTKEEKTFLLSQVTACLLHPMT